MDNSLLSIKNLTVEFPVRGGGESAVEGISLNLGKGKVLGIVGESGSGKSVTALSIMRLIPEPGKISGGEILLNLEGKEVDLLQLKEKEMRKVRGGKIGMIFQ